MFDILFSPVNLTFMYLLYISLLTTTHFALKKLDDSVVGRVSDSDLFALGLVGNEIIALKQFFGKSYKERVKEL